MKHSTRVAWLLAVVSMVSYAMRVDVSVAQEQMAPALGLGMADMGIITGWGFQLAYALFQLPAGALGDRYGARLVLGLSILGWSVAAFASALVPGTGTAAFVTLFAVRSLLGASQAAMYPVASLAVTEYVPAERRTTTVSVYIATATLGAALTPLLFTPLMTHFGWRVVFAASGTLGLATAVLWFALAPRETRARPYDARGTADRTAVPLGQQLRAVMHLLGNRPLMLLSTSYLLHSGVFFVFVFWFFRYLTEARGLTLSESGLWASVPTALAFVLGPMIGMYADRIGRRWKPAPARRAVAMACLGLFAVLVLAGTYITTSWLAIVVVGLAVACLNAAEAPFWATSAALGGGQPGAAGGVLNLMGNLGGVITISLVPMAKDAFGWTALLVGLAALAVVAAMLWMTVRLDDPPPT